MKNYNMPSALTELTRMVAEMNSGSRDFESYAPSQALTICNLIDDGIWEMKSLSNTIAMRKWFAAYADFLWTGS